MKVKELFFSLRNRLQSAGIESSSLEAEWMIGFVLNIDLLERIKQPERPVQKSELAAIDVILARRLAGEPLAYILEEKDFFGSKFKVTPDVLIPRPETEHLVECALEWIRDHFQKGETVELLELGVGSGCITVSLLRFIPEVKATAIDISDGALKVALENARVHGVEQRLELLNGDAGKSSQILQGRRYDLVLANPPYIERTDQNVDRVARDYEPETALYSPGEAGVGVAASWISELPKLVKPGQAAVGFEFGYNQRRMIESLFHDSKLFTRHNILQDYSGHDRLIWAER